MNKIWFLLLFSISVNGNPVHAQNQSFRVNTSLAYASESFLGLQNGLRPSESGIAKFNISYDLKDLSSQLSINYDEYNQFTLDGSYLQYTTGIATFGVGRIDRHWSFSEKTSLILSHNARPSKSIYLKLKNKFGYDWLPSKANWSFETFNGYTEGSLNNSKSMLLGLRAILSPVEGLDFELLQTSQWGGKGYSTGISALSSAIILDSNYESNSNINKMAGFGISYSIPSNILPLRIYGQTIGEDEAGSLPSCLSYLAGFELSYDKIKYPTIIGIETLDTRTYTSEHGHCGPNTMFNNNTYKYTNYGKVMGAAIDTESNSYELFGQSQISQKLNIKYSTKFVSINDNDWARHRLSSKHQSGLVNSLGATWSTNNISFSGNIYNQGFNLDKVGIKSGYGASLSVSTIF
jgi:hypothetical protein